jgi:Xaa-Pro aminopeptidase
MRQNSLEFSCLLITAKKVLAFYPRLSALGFSGRMEDFPEVDALIEYPDPDLKGEALKNELKALGLQGKCFAITRDITATLALFLQSLGSELADMSADVDTLRAVKDQEEIALMRDASAIADRIYKTVTPGIKPGMLIRELELRIETLLEELGASYSSFPAELLCHGPKAGIGVGAGWKYTETDHTLAYDYGVVYKGYCSDFGRTMFLQEPDQEFIKIHKLVMDAQKAGMDAMKAGRATGADCNAAARKVIEDSGYGQYFIHRLGHGIGKDVHERPFLALGEDRVLEAGMCFTSEPSIYIPKRGLVRVEDVVLVTETGYECLNTITKELQVLC